MKTLCFALLAVCLFLPASAPAISVALGPAMHDVPLQADGSVVLRPLDRIHLKLEMRDGKVVSFKAIPLDQDDPNAVTFSLFETELEVTKKMKGTLSFHCEYSFPDSPRPWKLLSVHGSRTFSRPVKQVRLSGFEFKPE